jgi:hypothetical protein
MNAQSVPNFGLFLVLWLVWLAVGIAALVAFFRGMNALARIPAHLERIERALESRASTPEGRAT